MLLILALVLAGAFTLAIWFLPVQLRAAFSQEALQAHLQVHLQAPLVSVTREINLSALVMTGVEHLVKRWHATSEPLKTPLQKTIRRAPRQKIAAALRYPLRYLGNRTRCSRLEIGVAIGCRDAMETALAAGAAWAGAGCGVSWIRRLVQVGPEAPRVTVTPVFAEVVWHLHADCILRFRLGHAMIAAVWTLRRLAADREVRTWLRESWRRKGAEVSERSSDRGTHEDGHGEH